MEQLTRSVNYYNDPTVPAPTWRGRPCLQFRADLWKYAELMWRFKPPFVIEIGTREGGTASFLADIMSAVNPDGIVITIDVNAPQRPSLPELPNLYFIEGSSTDEATLLRVRQLVGDRRGFVLIDGDHRTEQVGADLDAYHGFADYLVVQDTIMAWLDGYRDSNPHIALGRWLPAHFPEFQLDAFSFDVSQHPDGWLRRRARG